MKTKQHVEMGKTVCLGKALVLIFKLFLFCISSLERINHISMLIKIDYVNYY